MYNEIYIGNVLESYYKTYEKLPENERNYWRRYDSLENGRSLLYGGDNKVLVTPCNISQEQIKHICEISGWSTIKNISAKSLADSICLQILNESVLNDEFVRIVKENPGISIIPYRQTPEFYTLIKYLKDCTLQFKVPETPSSENLFIEKYFHSKRGFRHLWEMISDDSLKIKIPMGFICADKEEAIDAGFWFTGRGLDFTFKYNRGVQGIGVMFFENEILPKEKERFSAYLKDKLYEDIWNEPSIIVEEKIDVDITKFGGSPNVEMSIDQEGVVHREYACEQVLADDRKTFMGVSMNREVTHSSYIETAFKSAERYGDELAKLGYRGFYDMDLVISKDGSLYAVESNLRRTGGTHAHMFARSILGDNYWDRFYILLKDIKDDRIKDYSPSEIFKKLRDILLKNGESEGVVIVNVDMAEVGVLPLFYVSSDKERLHSLINRTEELLFSCDK